MKGRIKLKYISALIILVILPIGLLLFLGIKMADEESLKIENQFKNIAEDKLMEYKNQIFKVLDGYSLKLLKLTDVDKISREYLLKLTDQTIFTHQFFQISQEGKIVFPSLLLPLTAREKDFLTRTSKIFKDRLFTDNNKEINKNFSKGKFSSGKVIKKIKFNSNSGWKAYYWERGINLIFWHLRTDGNILGAELNKNRLISDILINLPDLRTQNKNVNDSIYLYNSTGKIIMRNGSANNKSQNLIAEIYLEHPFLNWKLQYYSDSKGSSNFVKKNIYYNLVIIIILISNLIIFSGWYLYSEHRKELEDASRKVSFVNQVSHELKTPLTNIRMHGELLEDELELETSQMRKAGIIVSESRRLSRLVGNILDFGKSQRSNLTIRYSPVKPDEIIENILEHFTPSFTRKKIEIIRNLNCREIYNIDPDIVEQIIGNLMNNVEKYCSENNTVYLGSRFFENKIYIYFRDTGPGIPKENEEFIFEQFSRLNNSITEGVSGTGIGLSISRDLARSHGGDLILYWNNGKILNIDFQMEAETDSGLGFILSFSIKDDKEEKKT